MSHAALHKRQFLKLLDKTGVTIQVRLPLPRNPQDEPGDMASRVFGAPTWETGRSEPRDVKVIWNNDYTSPEGLHPDSISAPIASLAHNTQKLDAVLRVSLEDVLLDKDKPQGRTLFDVAKDVLYQGQVFEILGLRRTGLPPLGPYILWVGLRTADREAPR